MRQQCCAVEFVVIGDVEQVLAQVGQFGLAHVIQSYLFRRKELVLQDVTVMLTTYHRANEYR